MCDAHMPLFPINNSFITSSSSATSKLIQSIAGSTSDSDNLLDAILEYARIPIFQLVTFVSAFFVLSLSFTLIRRFELLRLKSRFILAFLSLVVFCSVVFSVIFLLDVFFWSSSITCQGNQSSSTILDTLGGITKRLFECEALETDILASVQGPANQVFSSVFQVLTPLYIGLITGGLSLAPILSSLLLIYASFVRSPKGCYWCMFNVCHIIIWLMATICIVLSLSLYDVDALKQQIRSSPSSAFGDEICRPFSLSSFAINPCTVVSQCFDDSEQSFLDVVFQTNQTRGDGLITRIVESNTEQFEDLLPNATTDQIVVISEIILDENFNEILPIFDSNNATVNSSILVDVLVDTILPNVGTLTDQNETVTNFVNEVIDDVKNSSSITSEELDDILENNANVLGNLTFEELFPFLGELNLGGRRRLQTSSLIPSSISCITTTLNYVVDLDIKCSLFTNLYDSVNIAGISNSMFLYSLCLFLFSSTFFVLTIVLFVFTETLPSTANEVVRAKFNRATMTKLN